MNDHQRENGIDRAIRWLMTPTVIFFAAVITIGALTAPDDPRDPPFTGGGHSYSHEQLQPDANMTQQMSTPNVDGHMQRGQITDAQLERSRNPGYLRALEQHQSNIDRMLARPGP